MKEFKDLSGNPITINLNYIVRVYCDSEVSLITGEKIKLDIAYSELLMIIRNYMLNER